MNRQALEVKADRIEAVLAQHHAPVKVTGGNVTPRWIQFMVQPDHRVTVDRVATLSREIAQALGVPTARISAQGGAVRIEVRRDDPPPVSLSNMLNRLSVDKVPAVTAVLGLADDGAPLLARLPSGDAAHVLICGGQCTGKTPLLVTMLLSLAHFNTPRAVQLVIVGNGVDQVRHLPHLLAGSLLDMTRLLDKRSAERGNMPRVIVAIDELSQLDAADRVAVTRLLTSGAACGLHLIAIGDDSSADWPVRIQSVETPGNFIAQSNVGQIRFCAALA